MLGSWRVWGCGEVGRAESCRILGDKWGPDECENVIPRKVIIDWFGGEAIRSTRYDNFRANQMSA